MSDVATARALLESLGSYGSHFSGDDVAHLEVSGNEVVGSHLVPGLDVDIEADRKTASRPTSACARG